MAWLPEREAGRAPVSKRTLCERPKKRCEEGTHTTDRTVANERRRTRKRWRVRGVAKGDEAGRRGVSDRSCSFEGQSCPLLSAPLPDHAPLLAHVACSLHSSREEGRRLVSGGRQRGAFLWLGRGAIESRGSVWLPAQPIRRRSRVACRRPARAGSKRATDRRVEAIVERWEHEVASSRRSIVLAWVLRLALSARASGDRRERASGRHSI